MLRYSYSAGFSTKSTYNDVRLVESRPYNPVAAQALTLAGDSEYCLLVVLRRRICYENVSLNICHSLFVKSEIAYNNVTYLNISNSVDSILSDLLLKRNPESDIIMFASMTW